MTDSSRRIVLGALSAGFVVMFALSVAWRMGDHPLIRQRPEAARTAATAEGPRSMMEQGADSPQGQAVMSLMQKMKDNPNDVDTLLQIAGLFAEQGDNEGAKSMAQRALTLKPGFAVRRFREERRLRAFSLHPSTSFLSAGGMPRRLKTSRVTA